MKMKCTAGRIDRSMLTVDEATGSGCERIKREVALTQTQSCPAGPALPTRAGRTGTRGACDEGPFSLAKAKAGPVRELLSLQCWPLQPEQPLLGDRRIKPIVGLSLEFKRTGVGGSD